MGIDVPLNPLASPIEGSNFCRFVAPNTLERELSYQGEEWFAAPDSGFQILAPGIKISFLTACFVPSSCLVFLLFFPVVSFFLSFFSNRLREVSEDMGVTRKIL